MLKNILIYYNYQINKILYVKFLSMKERDIETRIEYQLRELGWIDDINNKHRTVYKQGAKTKEQDKMLGNTRPDFILYPTNGIKPLAIIEAKSTGKNLKKALTQGLNYAEKIGAPIVYATDGVFTRSMSTNNKQPLLYNGIELDFFLNEKELLHFEKNHSYSVLSERIKLSRRELISYFKQVDTILRSEGIDKGINRISEFSSFLFLKLLTEEKENILHISWKEDIAKYSGEELKNRIIPLIESLSKRYKSHELFRDSISIKNPENIEKIVHILNNIRVSEINTDIKGDAFEFFLNSYSKGSKTDLGQYFTPRHIIRLMVKILNPKIGETIYDPFCGTGGMLIECFKFLKRQNKLDEEQLKRLKYHTLYGRDISDVIKTTKMNMIMFGDGYTNIEQGDSLSITNKNYDIVVTNIPFSQKTKYGNLYDIPTEDGDSICLQHCLKSLKEQPQSRACIIVPVGFLYKKIHGERKKISNKKLLSTETNRTT